MNRDTERDDSIKRTKDCRFPLSGPSLFFAWLCRIWCLCRGAPETVCLVIDLQCGAGGECDGLVISVYVTMWRKSCDNILQHVYNVSNRLARIGSV